MMHVLAVFAATLLLLVSHARAAGCAANSCLAAVRANHYVGTTAGCTSFLRQTVTPTPYTSLVTVTSSCPPPPPTETVTTIVTSTDASTTTSTQESDTTSTKVITVPETTTTVTTSYTTTTTVSIYSTTVIPDKRDAQEHTCPVATAAPSQLPNYAAICGDVIAYASACSCVGVSKSTITLPQCTTRITTTITPTCRSRTKTVTSTSSTTETDTTTVKTVSTNVAAATTSETLIEATVTNTVSMAAVSTTTIAINEPSPFAMLLYNTDGSPATGPLSGTSESENANIDAEGGTLPYWYLDSQGYLVLEDNGYVANITPGGYDYAVYLNDINTAENDYSPLICDLVPSAIGPSGLQLQCSANTQITPPIATVFCFDGSELYLSSSDLSSCPVVTIAIEAL